jgi:hypothetical protein
MEQNGKRRQLAENQIEWAYEKWLDGFQISEIARALQINGKELCYMFQFRGMKRELPPLNVPEPVWDD